MSPEFNRQPDRKAETDDIAKEIERQLAERYSERILANPKEGQVFESGKMPEPMETAHNGREGVIQNLLCLIQAGNEFFSVINSTVAGNEGSDPIQETLLARHVAGGRAEIVGLINENSITSIGRSSENDFDKTVSRSHFAIAKSEDGSIAIADLGSTNHTRIFNQKLDNPYSSPESDDKNPINNIDFWSVKSASVKSSIEAARANV